MKRLRKYIAPVLTEADLKPLTMKELKALLRVQIIVLSSLLGLLALLIFLLGNSFQTLTPEELFSRFVGALCIGLAASVIMIAYRRYIWNTIKKGSR